MIRFSLCFSLCFLVFSSLHADELTKSVQGALKEQGFFYGEATGASGPETAAAIKRYQIRSGLEVTGTLTKETLESLNLNGDAAPPVERTEPVAPPPQRATPIEPEAAPRPPVDLRRDNTTQEKDREFLRRDTPRTMPEPPVDEPVRRPLPPPTAGGPYGHLFTQTPYANAPLGVQEDTIKRAQRFLRDLSMYRQDINGRPGPALEEGILSYQRFVALPLTGRLDLETLAAMRLLPGRGGAPAQSANPHIRTVPGKPLKGVWVK